MKQANIATAAPESPPRPRTAPIRVLIAKPGLDGHDQGAKVIVRGLMDAGFEVIYSGLRQTPEAVARMAQDEDVDVIGLSSLAGSHLPFCRRLRDLLHAYQLDDKLWLVGGNIPAADFAKLKDLGIAGIFPTGSRLADVAQFIRGQVK